MAIIGINHSFFAILQSFFFFIFTMTIVLFILKAFSLYYSIISISHEKSFMHFFFPEGEMLDVKYKILGLDDIIHDSLCIFILT